MANIDITYRRPHLYAKQKEAIFAKERWSIIEASTKAGKTVGCLVWIFEQALFRGKPGRYFWWVAPVYAQALIAFRRLKRWCPESIAKANAQELTLTLFNGAVIVFKSGEKPDNLYGEDVWAAVIDEATRVREESFFAVRSTLTATRGPCRIIGNVKGRKNWVHKMGMRAKAEMEKPVSQRSMCYHKLTAYDAVEAGVLSRSEIEDAKATLPVAVFNELYLAIPTDDGANPFSLDKITHNTMSAEEWARAQTTKPVVWAWDLARKVDWTVGIALNNDREVCRLVRWQKPWTDCIDDIVKLSAGVPGIMDASGLGDVVHELVAKRHGNMEGFVFTARSRQQILEGLALSMAEGRGPRFPAGPIPDELENFEYVYSKTGGVTYAAPEGVHDDCVMALAMATEKWRHRAAQPTMGGILVAL